MLSLRSAIVVPKSIRIDSRCHARTSRLLPARRSCWQSPVICASSALDPSHPYPDPEEEKEVSHEAFMKAMENSMPPGLRIKGLQEFAASVWERRRRIPSQTYKDPLDVLFTEFDADSDGHLTAEEIANALQSRRVDITVEQITRFIAVVDENKNGTIERTEWPHFIFNMAVADLHYGAAQTATT